MADLKTTSTKRATVRGAVGAWQHDDALAAMDALDDLDTLLAENARLLAVAEAARAAVDMVDEENERDDLRRALYALEAP